MSSDGKALTDNSAHDIRRAAAHRLKSLYGFAQPYDFAKATPFIAAILLLVTIAAAAGGTAALGKMHLGTYRSFFFIYLGAVSLVAAAASFMPRLAWTLIALCFAEISLAATTSVLAQLGIVDKSMLPPDNVRHEFIFHPLLQGVPNPNYALSSPLRIHHDSHGLRGRERDPAEIRHQIVVAAVGGSTTYGLGISDEETWPAALERLLGSDYAVLNQGVSAYSTVEHVIQTLFYLDPYDITPRCAVYYVGWNDIPNAHLPNLDPAYAGGYHRGKTAALEARRTPLIADVSPLGDIVVSYLQLWIDTVPSAPSFSGLAIGEGSDSRLEAYFRRNIETIAAIDRQRGVTPIFVGQLLNRARLTSPGSTRWWPLVRDVDLWPLQARFNAILKETAEKSGSPAYIPPVEQFQDSDFVDKGHFSARGSAKFAAMLAPFVRANCQKSETTHAAGAAQ